MKVFNQWVIEKLIKLDVIGSPNEVQMLTWFPVPPFDNYTCAIRLPRISSRPDLRLETEGIKRLHFCGNYINILLNDGSLVRFVSDYIRSHNNDCERYTLDRKTIKRFSIVEHTSLTPVYPINVSTFRSSVIGNALAMLLRKAGIKVSVHYLVCDTARNIRLLLEKYKITELIRNYSNHKNDHVCGAAFCKALGSIGKFTYNDRITNMFPLSPNPFPEPFENAENANSEEDVRALCSFCIDGHEETLSFSNIIIDSYDYESEAFCEMRLEGNDLKPYLSKNIAYYSFLVDNNTTAFSIVSNRQQNVISTAISFLPEDTDVHAIFYHDVFFLEGETPKADNIKSGIFHSVDGYIENASKVLCVDKKTVANSLKLLLLASNPNCTITLNCISYCDVKEFVDLLSFIYHDIMAVQTWDGTISTDSKVAKNLILLCSSFSINKVFSCNPIPRFDISSTIAIIKKIAQLIKSEYLLKDQKINHALIESYRSLVFEIFNAIGI